MSGCDARFLKAGQRGYVSAGLYDSRSRAVRPREWSLRYWHARGRVSPSEGPDEGVHAPATDSDEDTSDGVPSSDATLKRLGAGIPAPAVTAVGAIAAAVDMAAPHDASDSLTKGLYGTFDGSSHCDDSPSRPPVLPSETYHVTYLCHAPVMIHTSD